MGFSHLLNTSADVETFKARFDILCDASISNYHEGDIKDQKFPFAVFFPLMSMLEGGVKFPVDTLLLRTLSFLTAKPRLVSTQLL